MEQRERKLQLRIEILKQWGFILFPSSESWNGYRDQYRIRFLHDDGKTDCEYRVFIDQITDLTKSEWKTIKKFVHFHAQHKQLYIKPSV